jgi:hypothetical protein
VSAPSAPTTPGQRPVLPPDVNQYFIPARSSITGAQLIYHPVVLGAAELRYSKDKSIEMTQQLMLLASFGDGPVALNWDQGFAIDVPIEDLEKTPQENAHFMEIPAAASKGKNYDKWNKDLASWLYRNQRLELLESPSLDIVSNPGESERDFRVRLQQLGREQRDRAVEKLRQRFAPRIAQLEEKRRRAEQAVEREAEQAKGQKVQTAISFATTLLSSFMGRKTVSLTTLGRATTAARGVGRSMKESQDVARAQETVASVAQQQADLDAQFKEETANLERAVDPLTEELGKVSLKPTKANIAVKAVMLAWAPYWHDGQGHATPAWE